MTPIWVVATALATGISFEEVPCPYGSGQVRKYHKVSGNTHGGYDSDLAAYSTRGQFREHAISTCPDNYFSVMGSDLQMVIPPSKGPEIDAAIAESRQTWANRDDPEVWERYDTAARIARALSRDPLTVAELYLNASWTARDRAVGVYVGGLNGPQAARDILTIGQKELEKKLSPEAAKLLNYNLARVSHRGGFSEERDRYLDVYLNLPNLTPGERLAGLQLKHIAVQIEPNYQRQAIVELQRALSLKGPPLELVRARYQLADLQRRLGLFGDAKRNFLKVMQSLDTPNELKVMADFLVRGLAD